VLTEQIQIRAGSVALPLHNPIRVAEEWAIVDNLSQGRIGISFASGWHPLDFVLFPDKYQQRREIMFSDIEIVRRLWAGEAVKFPNVDGCEVEVRTLPRPIQAQLPIWITTSSSLETWLKAGEIGANIFAALVSYSFEELTRRISIYRQTLVKHGHDPQACKVTLMLHTFVGDDESAIKERVRPHLTNYLCSHMQQSTHTQRTAIRREDVDEVASLAFENYFATSSLLGTPQKCSHLLERLLAIGVDEAACLIDFGLDIDAVMDGLCQLNQLKNSFNQRRSPVCDAHM
jgi:natural product biosynthesis luciferase-like monooxygenase protein